MNSFGRQCVVFMRQHLRLIALVQLFVLVMLALSAFAHEPSSERGTSSVSLTAEADEAGGDECPCCPDENKSGDESCSTCSYCSCYAPLTLALSIDYYPAVAELIPREPFTKLPEVHIPIVVPPQNLA